jgi:type IV pilus assembly protein PilE
MQGRACRNRFLFGRCHRGFTLIELCIAVMVLAIIASFAFPAYRSAIRKSRRSEGKILLQTAMAAEERYYGTFDRYSLDFGATGLGISTKSTPSGFYELAEGIVGADGQSVSLVAVPQNAQADDPCGELTLDSTGRRGANGISADCW